MERSRLTVIGRHAVVWVAATLAIGASLDAAAVGNKGIIHLVTNNSTGVAEFRLEDPSGNITQYQQFTIQQGTKCVVDDDGYLNWPVGGSPTSGTGSLVDVHADSTSHPYSFKGNSGVGLIGGSLGVYNNSNGTSCGRITGALGESLTLTPQIAGFDKLSLDVEAKGSAVFVLTIDPPNGDKYYLFTGNNAALVGTEVPDDAQHQACSNGSDSGPDSGANDNCRWDIEAAGGSFKLSVDSSFDTTGVKGEGSLEGGGDEVDAGLGNWAAYSTKLYLTSLIDIGSLGCDSAPADPDNMTAKVYSDDSSEGAASCQVTRINPDNFLATDSPYKCTSPIGYRLETFKAESLCTLDKTGDVREQLASSMQVTFPPEPRVAWDGVAKTAIQFTKPDGSLTPVFYAQRCGGTVVDDLNGNPTIKEVLLEQLPGETTVATTAGVIDVPFYYLKTGTKTLDDTTDLIPGNGYIDWACVLDNREVILSDDLMQVTQTILFWGDIAFSRN